MFIAIYEVDTDSGFETCHFDDWYDFLRTECSDHELPHNIHSAVITRPALKEVDIDTLRRWVAEAKQEAAEELADESFYCNFGRV